MILFACSAPVQSIELLLQVIVEGSRSGFHSGLEEDAAAWVRDHLYHHFWVFLSGWNKYILTVHVHVGLTLGGVASGRDRNMVAENGACLWLIKWFLLKIFSRLKDCWIERLKTTCSKKCVQRRPRLESNEQIKLHLSDFWWIRCWNSLELLCLVSIQTVALE